MLTKTALTKLTQAVTNKVLTEARAYNQKLVESVTQEDLRDQFLDKVNMGESYDALHAWSFLETHYPPVFTELLSCLREDRKLDRLEFPCSYNLHEIVRPEVERLTMSLDEYDSDSLLAEQLFEKIYPMLVDAKYIYFESEKHEPVFDLTLPTEEFQTAYKHYGQAEEEGVDIIEEVFDRPYLVSGNENSFMPEFEDEGDWE